MRPGANRASVSEAALAGDPTALVIKALENPEYEWRTIQGVSRETGLSDGVIQDVLQELRNRVIQSSFPDAEGRTLFTTRDHYRKHQSVANRIISAISDTVR